MIVGERFERAQHKFVRHPPTFQLFEHFRVAVTLPHSTGGILCRVALIGRCRATKHFGQSSFCSGVRERIDNRSRMMALRAGV